VPVISMWVGAGVPPGPPPAAGRASIPDRTVDTSRSDVRVRYVVRSGPSSSSPVCCWNWIAFWTLSNSSFDSPVTIPWESVAYSPYRRRNSVMSSPRPDRTARK